MSKVKYRGRFAPSPTGDLHIGSLIAAVGSYLIAKSQQGEWWLRIEDIDPPREISGATDHILRTLDAFGFEWENLSFQHARQDIYQHALETLHQHGLVYPCICSRKTLAENHPVQRVYPGLCRHRTGPIAGPVAWRVRCPDRELQLQDGLQGNLQYHLAKDIGDFIVKRADGLFSYQLAVAVDDAAQGMTDVVRGADLLDSTPRQIHIQQLLNLTPPRYLHLPVIVNSMGQKLSKQTHAPPLDANQPIPQLWSALHLLGQNPPTELQSGALASIWDWAFNHWNPALLPQQRYISLDESRI